MRKRCYILLLLLFLLLPEYSAAVAEEYPVQLIFEGRSMETPAHLVGGTTYVPLRSFFDEIGGYTVAWNAPLRQASVTAEDSTHILFTQNSHSLSSSDRWFYMQGRSMLRSGSLWVPARGIATALGQTITYNGSSRTVSMEGQAPLTHGSQYYDADAVYWLARIIHAEAQGEPLQGQIAVGNVVLNRVADPAFPSTIYTVIFDRRNGVQFTPVANGSIYNTPSAQAVTAAKTALEGCDVTDGCLYFFNPQLAQQAQWIVENRRFFGMIGNHAFYY